MSTEGRDQHYGLLASTPGARAWVSAHPAATAALQGLAFAILFGVVMGLYTQDPIGVTVAVAAGTGILFGLAMWAVAVIRRRRAARA